MCVASAQRQCPDRAAAWQCNRKARVLLPRGTGVVMRLVGVGAGGASERAGSACGGATSARPTRGPVRGGACGAEVPACTDT